MLYMSFNEKNHHRHPLCSMCNVYKYKYNYNLAEPLIKYKYSK